MPISNDDKLKIVMTEYKILRREAMERVKLQLQLYPLALGAISLLFGYVLINQRYEALLLLPFITILLAFRWIWEVKMVDANRRYLLKIENEIIPKLTFSEEEKDFRLVGWQSYYEQWRKKQPKDWLISAIFLLGVPTLISILYFIWFLGVFDVIFNILSIDPSSIPTIFQMPNILYLLAALTYSVLGLRILWIGKRALQERERKNVEPKPQLPTQEKSEKISPDTEETRARESFFLVFGVILGIVGNLFVSALVEAVNPLIFTYGNQATTTFWLGVALLSAYPIVRIIGKVTKSMIRAKIMDEKEAKEFEKETKFVTKWALVGGIILIIVFFLQVILQHLQFI